jgi:hypothetical protein
MALSNLTKLQTVGIGSNIEVVGVITTGQFKSGTSNLHSTGVELTNLNVSGIATIGGNLSIGGTLTYQDVTNIDSVGLITARNGINVSGGNVTIVNDLDVDGHTNLDNTSIAGIVTAQQIRYSSGSGNWNGHPRSVVLGYSGSNYANLGMGWVPTGTNDQYTSQNTDLQSRLQLFDGLQIFGSGAPVANGQTVTWKNVADFKPNAIKLYTSGNSNSEKLRITSTGLVGINESSPGTHLHVNSAGYDGVATFESTDANAHILIKDNSTHANGTYFGVQGDDFRFITHNGSSSTEKLRITNAGNIQHRDGTGISYFNGASEYIFGSTTSSPPAGGSEARVQIHDYKTRAQFSINAYMNNAGGPFMNFLSSRSGTPGTLGTKCLNGDSLGDIRFTGDNGTNYNSVAYGAQIYATAASTPGDGDTTIAGRLKFVTGTANAGSLPVVMELREDGQLNLKRGRVNDAGHMVYRAGGRIAGTATVSFDIPVLSDGNIYWIEAFYTHHSLSYGGYLYGVYGAYSGHSGLQINNTIGSSTAGGSNVGTWSVSRGSAGTPVVVAKSAGSYGGMGYYWIHVHAGTTSNL